MKTKCSVCGASIESDECAILTMGGFATPRYICKPCEEDIDKASTSKDIEEAALAMERVGRKMADYNVEDKAVLDTVGEIMAAASERAEKIKNGIYDFSEEEDAIQDAEEEEIPEELRETEEDRELDRREAEANKKMDKITNWVCFVLLLATLGFLAYRIIAAYFL